MEQPVRRGLWLQGLDRHLCDWHWSLLRLALCIGSLGLFFGPALVAHVAHAADPLVFSDDVRQQIYPFFTFRDPQLFPDDLPARYYLDSYPLGYRLLYTWLAPFFDPAAVSKVVPYLLLGILLAAIGLASYRLGGWLAAWFTLVFGLSTPYFLARLAGGLPRSFGLTLLACAIAALVRGRIILLALCAVLGAAFYAPVAVLCGLAFAVVLFVVPRQDRGEAAAWSLRKRLVATSCTMLLCVLLLLPVALSSSKYGRILVPSDVREYPELGIGGRYGPDDRAPFDSLATAMLKMLPEAFRGRESYSDPELYAQIAAFSATPWATSPYQWGMLAIAGVLGAGLVVKAGASPGARRLGTLLFAVCFAYVSAAPVAPYLYLPQRYTAYAIPLLAVILFPTAAGAIADALGRHRRGIWMRRGAVLLACGTCYAVMGGRGNPRAGMITVSADQAQIYRFVDSLPKAARLAAWPGEVAANIPYVSRREVLISPETHQVFHQRYADEMRSRMHALIDAYYATDPAPLIKLRDAFGVAFLVVDTDDFSKSPPTYFRPFDAWALAARQKAPRDVRELEVFRQMAHAAVFRSGSLVVLDLQRISVTGTPPRLDRPAVISASSLVAARCAINTCFL